MIEKDVKLKIYKPQRNKTSFSGHIKNIKLTDFDMTLKEILKLKFQELETEYNLKVDISEERQ